MRPWVPLVLAAALLGSLPLYAASRINSLTGVYKHRITGLDAAHTEFEDDEILEIAKVSETAAYFRTYTAEPNHHDCTMSGVATLSATGLRYVKQITPDEACRFSITLEGASLVFHDEGAHCQRRYCSFRAGQDGSAFPLQSTRDIRDMKTLLGSKPYKEALSEYEAAPK